IIRDCIVRRRKIRQSNTEKKSSKQHSTVSKSKCFYHINGIFIETFQNEAKILHPHLHIQDIELTTTWPIFVIRA
ncbi:MAG: hypothetical protein QNK79_09230, partial [Synechococcus sp. ArSW.bin.68]